MPRSSSWRKALPASAAWGELERRHPELGGLRSVVKLAINEEFAAGDRVLPMAT